MTVPSKLFQCLITFTAGETAFYLNDEFVLLQIPGTGSCYAFVSKTEKFPSIRYPFHAFFFSWSPSHCDHLSTFYLKTELRCAGL